MRTLLILLFVFTTLLGCKSSKMVIDDTHPIHTLVGSKNFIFTAKSANPMVTRSLNAVANSGLIAPGSTISRIDLSGNNSYLKVLGDSVSANLPYYGERQFGGGYGSATGVEFDGKPDNYLQEFNNDKQKYTISFQITGESDRYTIQMDVYPSKSSTVYVTMANRNAIQYDGSIKTNKIED
ncbi:hypothetical protein LCGC14_0128720 [marine sediment metagenome]|uniref:DUF4251 domain-containing protein n=1 Tax=marine sediment metagenome TaxID=412755 RepID=A0A0F9V4D2_9ZZZZ|nr:DUF4251 domain-containing protein [Maribacter sp.]HDZ06159.1 DUF4251 domain-containing protein [Maribacter sp.]HEA80703.1 DUF4251 domain-containing protein [Maribacter sp.]